MVLFEILVYGLYELQVFLKLLLLMSERLLLCIRLLAFSSLEIHARLIDLVAHEVSTEQTIVLLDHGRLDLVLLLGQVGETEHVLTIVVGEAADGLHEAVAAVGDVLAIFVVFAAGGA